MTGPEMAAAVATAVADRTPAQLGELVVDDVRLRALLPGGLVEEHGRDAVLARFDRWFGSYGTVVLDAVVPDLAADRLIVHYRLTVDPDADRHVITQTLVCTVWDGLIGRIDLVCSGFRRF